MGTLRISEGLAKIKKHNIDQSASGLKRNCSSYKQTNCSLNLKTSAGKSAPRPPPAWKSRSSRRLRLYRTQGQPGSGALDQEARARTSAPRVACNQSASDVHAPSAPENYQLPERLPVGAVPLLIMVSWPGA